MITTNLAHLNTYTSMHCPTEFKQLLRDACDELTMARIELDRLSRACLKSDELKQEVAGLRRQVRELDSLLHGRETLATVPAGGIGRGIDENELPEG